MKLERECEMCHLTVVHGKPDPCIGGFIPGVIHACCGHGVADPYVVLANHEPGSDCNTIRSLSLYGAAAASVIEEWKGQRRRNSRAAQVEALIHGAESTLAYARLQQDIAELQREIRNGRA